MLSPICTYLTPCYYQISVTTDSLLPGLETWINQTVDRYRVLGEAQYIPIFGDQGILVFLGGDEPTSRSLGDWNDLGRALAAMDSITIYDIASKQWYEQKATGTIPEGRFGFCSVVVTDPSNSTYEM